MHKFIEIEMLQEVAKAYIHRRITLRTIFFITDSGTRYIKQDHTWNPCRKSLNMDSITKADFYTELYLS